MNKPPVIAPEQVTEQLHALQQQIKHLESTLHHTEHRIQLLETSIKENEILKKQAHELMTASMSQFELEWKRKGEYFPDIRLNILQKTVDLLANAPPPAKS